MNSPHRRPAGRPSAGRRRAAWPHGVLEPQTLAEDPSCCVPMPRPHAGCVGTVVAVPGVRFPLFQEVRRGVGICS